MNIARLASLLLVAVLVAVLSSCCRPPLNESHNVRLMPQERDWWCWAATTEMIADYYGETVPQCEQANFVEGTPPDCCTGCTGDCPCWGSRWGASLTDLQNNWTNWGFSYTYDPSDLSWIDLTKVVSQTSYCSKSPVQAVWWWSGGGGHVVTVTGYAEIPEEDLRFVFFNDPWPPDCQQGDDGTCSPTVGGDATVSTYAAFRQSGTRSWGDSFYRFGVTGP